MRRTIRLTGRRQLPVSCADVNMRDLDQRRLVTLTIREPEALRGFSQNARISLRLVENKQMELLDFGTVGSPRPFVELRNKSFGDPSCQLRVAETSPDHLGLLLGSTRTWRLNSDRPQQEGSVKGILRFQSADIAPRAWKLDLQDDVYPLILIDKRINDARTWAKTNPVFVACVLPAILEMVFGHILSTPDPTEVEWMRDWLRWADTLMQGEQPPSDPDDEKARGKWIDGLIESFCHWHRLSDKIIDEIARGGGE